jgi:hypothetical protein
MYSLSVAYNSIVYCVRTFIAQNKNKNEQQFFVLSLAVPMLATHSTESTQSRAQR